MAGWGLLVVAGDMETRRAAAGGGGPRDAGVCGGSG